jgi:hypothetical protein
MPWTSATKKWPGVFREVFILRGFGVHDVIRLFLTSRLKEIYQDHPAMRRVTMADGSPNRTASGNVGSLHFCAICRQIHR